MELFCILLVVACGFDYRQGRIPNLLLILMMLNGCGFALMNDSVAGVVVFLVEGFLVMLLLYPLFKIGTLGAGDVKLYGVCAGYLPREKFLVFFFLSLLIAAIISLIKIIKESNAKERFCYFCGYMAEVMHRGQFHLYIENERERKAASICLAGPILCSVLLYVGGVY